MAPTTDEMAAEAPPGFPKEIVAAGAVAMVLVAFVVGLVVLRSQGDEEAKQPTTTSAVPETTTTSTSTTQPTTTTEATTTIPVPVTEPRPTTTLPPRPVGIDCPSESSVSGTVLIRDPGSELHFRDTPNTDGGSLATLGDGATIEFWNSDAHMRFDEAGPFRTWVKAQLPNKPGRCGWASANNIEMGAYALGDGALGNGTVCPVYQTAPAAIHICGDRSNATMTVVWKAKPTQPVALGAATPDGAGWKAQPSGSVLLFQVHNGAFTISENGRELIKIEVLATS